MAGEGAGSRALRSDDAGRRRPAVLAAVGLGVLGLAGLAYGWKSVARAQGSAAMQARPWAPGRPAAPARFSAYIEDLPIMPGLREQGDGFSFEMHQGGRLAQARFAGAIGEAAVRAFYASALPQLGWRAAAGRAGVYRRGRERLTFLIQPVDLAATRGSSRLTAVFVLSPDPSAPTLFSREDRRP